MASHGAVTPARPLTVGGLFSGIGGWELGLERAGMEIAWHCEADPFCRRVLEKHWPGVPTFEDVRTLTAGMAEGVDVLCGGFPCQDLSRAGKGAGIDGPRSGLWSEYARLIGEFRPRYVVVENVSDLLTRGMGRVLSDLAAVGYDAEWDCIPASAVGAPHHRERIWIVAYPDDRSASERGKCAVAAGQGARGRYDRGRSQGDASRKVSVCSAGENSSVSLADASGERLQGLHDTRGRVDLQSLARSLWRDWPSEPSMARVAYGIPRRLVRDDIHALGNALVPQISEWIGRRIVAYEDSLDGLPDVPTASG